MEDVEKRARELLAAEYEGSKFRSYAHEIRNGHGEWGEEIRAIIAALTPPEGFVLVPVEPTQEMVAEAWKYGVADDAPDPVYAYRAMLAARPEASP